MIYLTDHALVRWAQRVQTRPCRDPRSVITYQVERSVKLLRGRLVVTAWALSLDQQATILVWAMTGIWVRGSR